MLFIWLGLAAFSAFIAYRSISEGSYIRGTFAAFWLAMFVFAIWIDFQKHSAGIA